MFDLGVLYSCNQVLVHFFVDSAQEQQDHSYAASIQYQPGEKCFVSKDYLNIIIY